MPPSRLAACLVLAFCLAVADARATTPGANGFLTHTSVLGFDSTIVLRSPDGRQVRAVIDTGSGNFDPSWAPAGSRLSLLNGDGSCGSSPGAVVLNWPSRKIAGRLPSCRQNGISWSPDGTRVVFMRGDMDIYRASLRGAVTRLTDLGRNFEPSWSPDGRTIAFVSRRDGNRELYTMSWDGSNETRITSTPGSESSPDWSPDGRRIVFVRGRDLWIREVGNGDETRLTRTRQVERAPAWSPNGRLIAFTRLSEGRLALFVRDLSRGGARKVVAAVGGDPSWQPRCTLAGTPGPNFLVGGTSRDLVCAGPGDDFVTARAWRDAVFGGSGNDRLLGGSGDDVLVGGPGRDVLVGGPGRDLLSAVDRRGGDVLRAEPGDLCRADPNDTVIDC